MPNNPDDLGRICKAVSLPVNVLALGQCSALSHAQFAAAGAARISLGSAMARATHRLIKDIGTNMFSNGDFAALSHSISANAVEKIMFGNWLPTLVCFQYWLFCVNGRKAIQLGYGAYLNPLYALHSSDLNKLICIYFTNH